MPRLRGLTASPRSPSWPVAEYGWETRWVPLVPHPGTTALGTHSAPAERWKTWAHEGDLEPSHTYPGLSFLLCPSHRGLLVDMRSQGWQGFEKKKKQNPAQMQGVGAWAWECVDLWTTRSILGSILKTNPCCHLFPCYWLTLYIVMLPNGSRWRSMWACLILAQKGVGSTAWLSVCALEPDTLGLYPSFCLAQLWDLSVSWFPHTQSGKLSGLNE